MKRWILLAIALVLLIVSAIFYLPVLNYETPLHIIFHVMFLTSLVLVFLASYFMLQYEDHQKVRTLQNRLAMWTKLSYHVNQVGDEVFNELPIGILAIDEDYEIKWANPHAKSIFDAKITGKDLADVHAGLHQAAVSNKMHLTLPIKQDIYDVVYRPEYRFFYLFLVSDREKVKDQYQNQIPALAIINLDNLDEAMATLDVSEQSSLKGEYLGVIADWAAKYNGYLKPYSDERLLVMVHRKQLNLMIEDKFDLLEKIRQISQQNRVRVTLSLGIASWDVNYEELAVHAQNAIELAEKRGGDQVVVNIQDQKIMYFGAKSDATAKSSKIGARINAQTIKDFIDNANNVLIMGHNQADLDAYGSMLAVYQMAKVSKKNVYMVIEPDRLDQTVNKIHERLMREGQHMQERFISIESAMKLVNNESLLIVLDAQSPKVVMSPELLEKASKLVVIDHHRIGEEGFNATFSYIEPYASSTIELVMELMNFYNIEEDIGLSPLEATIMYGGLVVDTNNFTYRTGSRTFEVASRLKELGADTAEVKIWLRRDLLRTLEINRLLSQIDIFLDRFAFVVTEDIYEDRILLAQVADAALQINGIDAAFTIARIDEDTVGVSARSYQQINVQLLMESLGGGGHLSSAAAQVKKTTVNDVLEKLKDQIELEYETGGETMKIILLEDVKGKGAKNDVIDVANGFGQFLINQKKAVMATEDHLSNVNKIKEEARMDAERHVALMNKLKSEIDQKKVTLGIQIGQDGKLFGSVTTKQIVEAFETAHGILLDKKKVELDSEVNSIGIYTATVYLHKDIKAQFEVHIVEK